MKKAFYLFLLVNITSAFGQSEVHKKTADTFIIDFNNGDYEHIFQSFSPKMQRSFPKQAAFRFLSVVRKDIGKLLSLELYDYRENSKKARGTYDGIFDSETATVRITTNKQGLITGLYIKKKPIL